MPSKHRYCLDPTTTEAVRRAIQDKSEPEADHQTYPAPINGDQQDYRENAYYNRSRHLGRQGMSLLFGARFSLVTNLVRKTRTAPARLVPSSLDCCNSIAKRRTSLRLDRSANAVERIAEPTRQAAGSAEPRVGRRELLVAALQRRTAGRLWQFISQARKRPHSGVKFLLSRTCESYRGGWGATKIGVAGGNY